MWRPLVEEDEGPRMSIEDLDRRRLLMLRGGSCGSGWTPLVDEVVRA
jgi:hypothetical protein